jgi:predicted Zn-dependent protease
VEAAATEDMLAAIIAHELAHIMLKHGLTIIEDTRLYNEMSSMGNLAVQFAGTSASAVKLQYFRNSVAAITDTLVKNGFSQDQEFEADEGAVVLMAASGYNPAGLLDMLAVLQRVQNSQKGGFYVTHPNPALRIENAKKYVDKYVSQYRVQDTQASRAARFKNK